VYPFPTHFDDSRTRLTFMPEFMGNVGYAFTENFRGFVGYNLLFLRRVVRPVGTGNPTILPATSQDGTPIGGAVIDLGTARAAQGPALTNFREENLVVHGWNFGLEFRY
jgi:hypothetical protein